MEESVSGSQDAPSAEIEDLKKTVEAEKQRADKCLANWQRAQADYANLTRRTEQERLEHTRYANLALVSQLLPVIDDFERALAFVPGEDKAWADGVKMIYTKLQSVLQSQGLTEIESLGKDFDPNFHEAVLYVEGGEEGKVTEVVRKGYMLRDRVIRPAQVKVGKGEEKPASGEIAEDQE